MSNVVNSFSGGSAGSVFQASEMIVNQFPDPASFSLPNALPRTGILVARDADIATAMACFDPEGRIRFESPVAVLAGLAGSGKTALALTLGSLMRGGGWFDGTLFVALSGYAPDLASRMTGTAALGLLLRQLGVPAAEVCPDRPGREACYQALMTDLARRGKRLLVVADDASDVRQLRSLLPAGGGHGVLITSRHLLADLDGARVLEVGALSPGGSADVLDCVLRVARSHDERAVADPVAAAEVVSYCAGLPLALRIVGALLVGEPERTMRDVADSLACARSRLSELEYGDDLAVRAAFELSWRQLEPEEKRFFSMLAVAPGPRFGQESAAALAGLPERDARRLLSALRRAHMVEGERIHGLLRYRFHDLLKLYAEERLESDVLPDVREAAADRWLARCMLSAWEAEEQLEGEGDSSDSLAWFDTELPSLMAAVGLAAAMDRPRIARSLPFALGTYFQARGHPESCIASFEHALWAARHLGERNSEGAALAMLANAYMQVGRFVEARECQAAERALREEVLGDRSARADVLQQLGTMERAIGRWRTALDHHERARFIYCQVGDRGGEARSLAGLGDIWSGRGMHQKAVGLYRRALAATDNEPSRMTEGQIRRALGHALVLLGSIEEGMVELRTSLAIARARGAWGEEAAVHANVGVLCQVRNFPEAAEKYFRKSLEIFERCGDRNGEARAHYRLADAQYESSRFREAAEHAELSVAKIGPMADPFDEAASLLLLGRCRVALGEEEMAARHFLEAMPLAEASESRELIDSLRSGLDGAYEAVKARRLRTASLSVVGAPEVDRGRQGMSRGRPLLSSIRRWVARKAAD